MRTAGPIAVGSPRSCSATRTRWPSWRGCCTRSSRASTCSGGSSWARSSTRPRVCVTEVPLLYESGGESRFDKVVVVTAPRQLREQRRRVPLDNRDERLLDDREKVKRADFHYVNTGTFEELYDWVGEVMGALVAESDGEPA